MNNNFYNLKPFLSKNSKIIASKPKYSSNINKKPKPKLDQEDLMQFRFKNCKRFFEKCAKKDKTPKISLIFQKYQLVAYNFPLQCDKLMERYVKVRKLKAIFTKSAYKQIFLRTAEYQRLKKSSLNIKSTSKKANLFTIKIKSKLQ